MLREAVTGPGARAWPRVPPEDVPLMLPGLDQVAEEMIEAIQLGVPEYARPQNDTYRASVRQAVTHAVQEFVERLANPSAQHDRAAQVFRNIGRSEAAEGRSLEPLQMALRIGARVAWRRLGQQATCGSMDSGVLAPWVRRSSCSSTNSLAPARRVSPRPPPRRLARWSAAAAGCST